MKTKNIKSRPNINKYYNHINNTNTTLFWVGKGWWLQNIPDRPNIQAKSLWWNKDWKLEITEVSEVQEHLSAPSNQTQ